MRPLTYSGTFRRYQMGSRGWSSGWNSPRDTRTRNGHGVVSTGLKEEGRVFKVTESCPQLRGVQKATKVMRSSVDSVRSREWPSSPWRGAGHSSAAHKQQKHPTQPSTWWPSCTEPQPSEGCPGGLQVTSSLAGTDHARSGAGKDVPARAGSHEFSGMGCSG